ncbi:NapC/NirT family cytochrome c [Neobacillus niacini]|uniref:cytochrome c3 family protein n=1 Tax=Neobacillus niacini TaxID=86668 RepID=UPI00285F8B8A|nr:NapC/NirT family cytochrome c [Neobacillus niacini]MDR6998803.1 nitrate/TMAO reductase-like tetraheme cytochrome c subunit [Neobacillus niacini]
MEEEQNELPAPPRNRYKLIKYMTITLFFLAILFFAGFTGLEATSSSKFCQSCHEMKPEYYTWKASTHNEVDCVNCHTDPIFKKLAKDKAEGLVGQLKNHSLNVTATPIRMPNEVPNSACEKCHNLKTRDVTPSGDLIIPHEKHLKKGVECVQCHSSIAHGKIVDRKMTYQTDYAKWDQSVGTQAMSDLKFTRPDMDTCMECHKARNVSTACKTCHKTGMEPKSHKSPDFKTSTHGLTAGKDLQKCDSCHGYMSKEKIEGLEAVSSVEKVLKNIKTTKPHITELDYAKENTFCKDCHSKRPASHNSRWMLEHNIQASKDKQKCLACHNDQQTSQYQTTTVACSSCHPAMHKGFDKKRHPIPLAAIQKVTNFCYTCHVKRTCSACHRE